MKVKFLGTGDSFGTPRAGCSSKCCLLTKARNRRNRSSILIENDIGNILVDVSPDFRAQSIKYRIEKLDVILFTHAHTDHVLGIPDLRVYSNKQGSISCYASGKTIGLIKNIFPFIFGERTPELCIPELNMMALKNEIVLCDIGVLPIEVKHSSSQETFGYRFNDFGYIPDCKEISSESRQKLQGLDTLVIGALNQLPNNYPTHMNFEEAFEVIEDIKPKRSYITHLSHSFDYYGEDKEKIKLPKGVRVAYDGLAIKV